MPRIDHHAAASRLRSRYLGARQALEGQSAETSRLEALDALQRCLESMSPAALSSDAWQSLALAAFRLAFGPGPSGARELYAGGLLVFCYSTGISWGPGGWKDAILDAA